jgi:tetratricopeptide (TPR) repeat protein
MTSPWRSGKRRGKAPTGDCMAGPVGLVLLMTFLRRAQCCAAGILLAAGLCGCVPDAGNRTDEETEPHFLNGRKLASQMDYDGAVEAYEKAVEVNPHSAAAHFELAWLYEGKENDPAAAIYHYERFLKLAPNSGKAEVAQAHINNCKLALAETASAIAPISASAQRDLEKLLQENRELKSELAQLQALYQRAQAMASNPPAQIALSDPNLSRRVTGTDHVQGRASPAGGISPGSGTPVPARTHTVQPGDTLAAIARKYGISLTALEAANSQFQPTRLPVGSVLKLPPS